MTFIRSKKMSDKEEQLEIVLDPVENKPEEPEIQVVKAEETPEEKPKKRQKPEVTPDEGIQELRAKLEQERQARVEAERRAKEAADREYAARNEVQDTNLHLVNNAIDTLRRDIDILVNNNAEALRLGDYESAAKIQRAISANENKLLQLENGKTAMESQPKQAQQRPQYSDPIEALAAQVTPASAQWLRDNKHNLGNQKKIDKMFRAHADAVDDGVIPDTPEYFSYIENRLGISNNYDDGDSYDATEQAAKPVQRRQSPPAAPVSRSGTAPGTRPNVVRLTAEERELAGMMGMSDQEYARNKLALQREGKLN
jgi:hypothetical protein